MKVTLNENKEVVERIKAGLEKKGGYNITEVAYMCGFNNSAHFNKTFKKLKGKTPSDFKKYPENECF